MASNGWASALILLVALAGCGGAQPRDAVTDAGLEQAAIERGLVRGTIGASPTGLFADGSSRVCIVEQAETTRIGVKREDGAEGRCAAAGIARRRGDTLDITLGTAADCRFDARYDGDRIRFPIHLPEGCARFCADRASLAGLRVERISNSVAEAGALRDFRDRTLCPIDS